MDIISYSTSFSQGIALLLTIHSCNEEILAKTVSTKLLAEYAGIPFSSAVKTLKSLTVAGIIDTKEGAGGGCFLAKPVSQITLFDVFMAVEQDAPLFKTHTSIHSGDELVGNLKRWVEICITNATDAMKSSLRTVTLEDIWAEVRTL